MKKPRLSFSGLKIRTSLFLGFGAMSAVMLLATSIALVFTRQISESLSLILNKRLPATVIILRVARATDALAATGVFLPSVTTDADRKIAFARVEKAVAALQHSLSDLVNSTGEPHDIRQHADELTDNLSKMRDIVDQRIDLEERRQSGRDQLLLNLQAFQQRLTYRVRILEGDSDVIGRLLSRPSPPMDHVIELARKAAEMAPVSRFYTEVETITGRLFAATQDQTLTTLQLSKQILQTTLNWAQTTFSKLPEDIAADVEIPFAELQRFILAEDGLLAIRERQLLLDIENQKLIVENQRISHLVDSATSALVQGGLEAMSQAGLSANETRKRYVLILSFVTIVGLLGIAALMHYHVMRHVISRLSWLSEAMRHVADGTLDTPLPPVGNDELGRLGFAVRRFQETAVQAEQRETELRSTNRQLERARAELEQKAHELELANKTLEDLSVTDSLTGLANRRRFDEALATEWARAGRAGHSMALIMLDVDHFKQYNDRYGHQAGDQCLEKIALAMKKQSSRAGDLMARYGGEEFCVISAYTDHIGAQALAEKIRRAVWNLALPHEDSSFGVVTVSMGIAVAIPRKAQSANDLILAADLALYEAKGDGRNCIK